MFYYIFPSFPLTHAYNWPLMPVNPQSIPQVLSVKVEESQNSFKNSFSPTIIYSPIEQQLSIKAARGPITPPQKPSLKEKSVSKDEEYNPQVFEFKKSKKSQQLQNRNVVPNIIRLIISFLQKKGKSQKLVEKLLIRQGAKQGWSAKRFYFYQAFVRGKINNYVNQDTLTQMCRLNPQEFDIYSQEEQQLYSKVTRIIVSHFLNIEITNCVLTSKRMDCSKKVEHIRALRNIKLKLQQLLRA